MIITKKEFEKKVNKIGKSTIWQTKEWGNYQTKIGKTVFSIGADNWKSLIIKQKLPFSQNYLHIQRGPIGIYDEIFFEDLKEIAKEEKSIFVRISSENNIHFPGNYFNAIKDHFPETSLIIDLEKTEDEILKQMKQKGRYNIRLSQKKGVKIQEEKNSEKASEIFVKLMKETTERDGFFGHKKEIYKKMIDGLGEKIKVLVAYFEGKEIAAGIFTFHQEQAIYYYGASSNKYRNVMAPYLIQWKAIQIAKEKGCKIYDFLGIAKDENNKKDPWFGITQFKLKFGGEKIQYPKAFDIPVSFWKYFIYRFLKFFR